MAFIKEDMEPVLQKYAGFGYTIYYLYQKEKAELQDIQNIFLKLNPEIAFLYLEKVVHKIDASILDESYEMASNEYSKEQCLMDYFHLEEGKVTLRQDVYETGLNYHYTKKMLDILDSEDLNVSEQKIIGKYQELLGTMMKKTSESVMRTVEKRELSRTR